MWGSPAAARAVLPALLATGALLGGCSDSAPRGLAPDEVLRAVHRFADAAGGPRPPVATIRAESRHVLRDWKPITLLHDVAHAVPPDGRLALRLDLPTDPGTGSVLLAVHVRAGEGWVELPGRVARVASEGAAPHVAAEIDLPDAAGRTAGLWIQAFTPLEAGADVQRAPAVLVPERASFGFAIGVLEPAWGQGPVEFALLACRPRDGAPDEECEDLHREHFDPAIAEGWRDLTLDLAAHAGRRVSFRFEARSAAGAPTLPVWANPTLYAPAARAPDELDLVLVSLDTLGAGHVSAYGYPRETTPFLDGVLAADGTLFERYVAAASSTRPSHMTMFTSLHPSVHGANEDAAVRALPPSATTLAERLRAHGFETAAFTENGAIDRRRGFGRGFDVFVEEREGKPAAIRTGHIEQTFERGLRWLEAAGGKRFFLFLHTYQVHSPFTPPPAYERLFTEPAPELEAPPGIRADWDPRLYDREIRYADDRLRELVGALEAGGFLDRALLVVTSDHGEAFLEHGFLAHGADVHDELLRVPLVLRGPGVPGGRRVAAPLAMVDLMPTLLELLSVPASGQEMGRSFAALVRGAESDGSWETRPIYSEAWSERGYRAQGMDRIRQPSYAVRVGSRKLLRVRDGDGHRHAYYDLARDPGERVDLWPERAAEARDLVSLLEGYQALTRALHEALGRAADADAPAPPTEPDLEEKLRALGYLE